MGLAFFMPIPFFILIPHAALGGPNNKDNYTVTFASDNEEVATVNGKGFVRAVAVGTANITATFTDEDGETLEKTCVVTVKKNAVAAAHT